MSVLMQIDPDLVNAAGSIAPLTYIAMGGFIVTLVLLVFASAFYLGQRGKTKTTEAAAHTETTLSDMLTKAITDAREERKEADVRADKRDAVYTASLLAVTVAHTAEIEKISTHLAKITEGLTDVILNQRLSNQGITNLTSAIDAQKAKPNVVTQANPKEGSVPITDLLVTGVAADQHDTGAD